MQTSEEVVPHAGEVTFVKPYVAGLATISFTSAPVLTRIVGMPEALSAP